MSILSGKRKINGIYRLSRPEIDLYAEDILVNFNRSLIHDPQPMDVDRLAENHLSLQLDFADITNNGSIIGLIAFSDGPIDVYNPENDSVRKIYLKKGTALIDNALTTEDQHGRSRFTIAHECAHWLLHRPDDLYYDQLALDLQIPRNDALPAIICRKSESSFIKKYPQTPSEWREWQADNLASALLMPSFALKSVVRKLLSGEIPVRTLMKRTDGTMVNINTGVLAMKVATTFEVSFQAAEVRLRKLGYLTDNPADPIQIPS